MDATFTKAVQYIYYGPSDMSRYEPNFIVETADGIFMVETKASSELKICLLMHRNDSVSESRITHQDRCLIEEVIETQVCQIYKFLGNLKKYLTMKVDYMA